MVNTKVFIVQNTEIDLDKYRSLLNLPYFIQCCGLSLKIPGGIVHVEIVRVNKMYMINCKHVSARTFNDGVCIL